MLMTKMSTEQSQIELGAGSQNVFEDNLPLRYAHKESRTSIVPSDTIDRSELKLSEMRQRNSGLHGLSPSSSGSHGTGSLQRGSPKGRESGTSSLEDGYGYNWNRKSSWCSKIRKIGPWIVWVLKWLPKIMCVLIGLFIVMVLLEFAITWRGEYRHAVAVKSPYVPEHMVPKKWSAQERSTQWTDLWTARKFSVDFLRANPSHPCTSAIDYELFYQYIVLHKSDAEDYFGTDDHLHNPTIVSYDIEHTANITAVPSLCNSPIFGIFGIELFRSISKQRYRHVRVAYLNGQLKPVEREYHDNDAYCIQTYIELFQSNWPCEYILY